MDQANITDPSTGPIARAVLPIVVEMPFIVALMLDSTDWFINKETDDVARLQPILPIVAHAATMAIKYASRKRMRLLSWIVKHTGTIIDCPIRNDKRGPNAFAMTG